MTSSVSLDQQEGDFDYSFESDLDGGYVSGSFGAIWIGQFDLL